MRHKITQSHSHISSAMDACLATPKLIEMKRMDVRERGSYLPAQLVNLDMCAAETTKSNHQLAKDSTMLRRYSQSALMFKHFDLQATQQLVLKK